MASFFNLSFCTKKDLYHVVDVIRAENNVNYENGFIDCYELCSRIEWIEIGRATLSKATIRGASYPKEGFIALNALRNPVEQNFDCAHELFHLVLHKFKERSSFVCLEPIELNSDQISEWQANEAAAEFLVPYRLFIPEFVRFVHACEAPSDYDGVIGYFASKYNVSRAVIIYRINSLKYEIYQYDF